MLKIEITNDETGNEVFGNYTYVVRVGNDIIQTGVILNHRRGSWADLVQSVLKAHLTKRAGDTATPSDNATVLHK